MAKHKVYRVPSVGLELPIDPLLHLDRKTSATPICRLKYEEERQHWRVLLNNQRGGLLVFVTSGEEENANTLRITRIAGTGTGVHAAAVYVEGGGYGINPFSEGPTNDVPAGQGN